MSKGGNMCTTRDPKGRPGNRGRCPKEMTLRPRREECTRFSQTTSRRSGSRQKKQCAQTSQGKSEGSTFEELEEIEHGSSVECEEEKRLYVRV